MRHITPVMPRELAQQIAWEESGDLKARWMLIDRAEAAYKERNRIAASLIHAYQYLADREAYEREPWPKGMIKLPVTFCRHAAHPKEVRQNA
jgi:hypothetical protein